MQLIVKTLCGTVYNVDVEETWTVLDVKHKTQEKTGIPPDQMRLIAKVKTDKQTEMDNDKKVKEYQLTDGETIFIVTRPLRCICECTEAPQEIKDILGE